MLNILPPATKLHLQQAQLFGQVKKSCLFIVGLFIIIDIGMTTGRIMIRQWVTTNHTITTTNNTLATQLAAVQKNLQTVSTTINSISQIQTDYHQPLPQLVQTIKLLPNNLAVSKTVIDYTTKTMVIDGLIPDQTTFAELQKTLSAHPELGTNPFPLSAYTATADIPFELKIAIQN